VILAFLDLKAMLSGRKSQDNWGKTLTGGVISGVSVLLRWAVISYCLLCAMGWV
jgi:hypothetical protein